MIKKRATITEDGVLSVRLPRKLQDMMSSKPMIYIVERDGLILFSNFELNLDQIDGDEDDDDGNIEFTTTPKDQAKKQTSNKNVGDAATDLYR